MAFTPPSRSKALPLLAATALLTTCVVAQGKYEVYGYRGCTGNGKTCGPTVAGLNTGGGTLADVASNAGRTYAFAARVSAETEICGFEILAHTVGSTPSQVTTYLFADDNGLPGAELATGTMYIATPRTPEEWQKTTFAVPVPLAAETAFWVGYRSATAASLLPVLTAGDTALYAFLDPNHGWQLNATPMKLAFRVNRLAPVGPPVCSGAIASANFGLPIQDATLPENTDFAVPFVASGRGGNVCGMMMYANNGGASEPVTVTAHLWLDDNGRPGVHVRSGKFTVTSTTRAYHATWSPYPIVRGQRFWFGWSNPSPSITPNLSVGGTMLSYASKPTSASTWQLAATKLPWNYVVSITNETGSERPTLTSSGTPRIGDTFEVHLGFAPAGAASLLWTGSSNSQWASLKLPAMIAGSHGCLLQVSFDGFVVGAVADALGAATIPFGVPMEPSLVGTKVCQQWLVVDALANPLGFTLSNGGRALIGP